MALRDPVYLGLGHSGTHSGGNPSRPTESSASQEYPETWIPPPPTSWVLQQCFLAHVAGEGHHCMTLFKQQDEGKKCGGPLP